MANHQQITGKIALISGAGSGIGLALAKELGRRGATIVGTDIHQDRLDGMLFELKKDGIKAFAYRVDHTSQAEVEALAGKVQATVGAVDILCANAGIGHGGKTESLTLDEWKWVVDINLWGAVYLVHFFLPSMIKRQQGQILITASGSGLFPQAGMAPYCMTKTALVYFANILRIELEVHNISVSALCPGVVKTNVMKDGRLQGEENRVAAIAFYESKGVSPDIIARTAIQGLMKKKNIIPAPWSHVMIITLLYRLSPDLMIRISRALFKRGRNFLGPFFKD